MAGGPRWDNFRQLALGKQQGMMKLSLPAAFVDELEEYKLHPALLDCATAFLSPFIKPALYIPLFYKNIRQYRPLTAEFYSHAVAVPSANEAEDTLSFDLTLFDLSGQVLIQITSFVRRLITTAGLEGAQQNKPPETEQTDREWVKQGLLSTEGIDAFLQILAGREHSVVVSKMDINAEISPNVTMMTETTIIAV